MLSSPPLLLTSTELNRSWRVSKAMLHLLFYGEIPQSFTGLGMPGHLSLLPSSQAPSAVPNIPWQDSPGNIHPVFYSCSGPSRLWKLPSTRPSSPGNGCSLFCGWPPLPRTDPGEAARKVALILSWMAFQGPSKSGMLCSSNKDCLPRVLQTIEDVSLSYTGGLPRA